MELQIRLNNGDYSVLVVDTSGVRTAFAPADRSVLIEAVQESDDLNLSNWTSGDGDPGEGAPDEYGALVASRSNNGSYLTRDVSALAALIERLQG